MAWANAEGGVGQIVLLHGEPGIGKTRTAAELAARVRGEGASVAVGRCPAARGAPAFWPWVQVLRELVTEEHAAELRARLGAGAALVAPLIPALRTARDDAGSAAGGEAERFLLCDGVASLLAHVSRERPSFSGSTTSSGPTRPRSCSSAICPARSARRGRCSW